MIRPEVKAGLRRWREALIGAGLLVWGLWWALTAHGYIPWIGWVIALIGLALAVTGVQRGRFRTGAGGLGVVQVTEGQVGYFGPFTGGVVALSDLSKLVLDAGQTPPCWRLRQPGQPDLLIPLNAEGSEALFDIFAALPDIRTARLVAQVSRATSGAQAGQPAQPVVIWERARLRLH
ncbi:hypothetical protein [Pseudooceanicola sp. 200-1SW]|uniref:hypothetical protein n=1 Tax=Pseudooceanicola sp. 200-1SW TaxID=3425949 RepID=UPI003D7F859A